MRGIGSSKSRWWRAGASVVAAILGTATAVAVSGSAIGAPSGPAIIASGLQGPLGLAVASNGTIYVSESNAGTVDAIATDGSKRTIAATAGGLSTGGVDVSRAGTVAYTVASGEGAAKPVGLVNLTRANGTVATLADFASYEKRKNPDGKQRYGFLDLTASCAALVPPEIGGHPHGGDVNSNPYAVLSMRDGSWFVADAGGNDVLKVNRHGRISLVAVLPASKVVVTRAISGALGLPACTIGKTYAFDPVPTDVELGPHGMLYVSSLPGGPEDASLGARGAVYTISRRHGHAKLLARGFLGATDLAVGYDGTVYVTELFGNKVSKIRHGRISTVRELNQPAAVELSKGTLYVSTDVFGPDGKVVSFKP